MNLNGIKNQSNIKKMAAWFFMRFAKDRSISLCLNDPVAKML